MQRQIGEIVEYAAEPEIARLGHGRIACRATERAEVDLGQQPRHRRRHVERLLRAESPGPEHLAPAPFAAQQIVGRRLRRRAVESRFDRQRQRKKLRHIGAVEGMVGGEFAHRAAVVADDGGEVVDSAAESRPGIAGAAAGGVVILAEGEAVKAHQRLQRVAIFLDQIPAKAAVDDIEVAAAGEAQEVAKRDVGVADVVDFARDFRDCEPLADRRPVERFHALVLRADDQHPHVGVALQQPARDM